MEELLKEFPHDTKRDYKGGKEVRVKDLDHSLTKARHIIAQKQLDVEVFDVCSSLRSFAVRPKVR